MLTCTPHIGLSTLTFLFEGAVFHRDSLGTAIEIKPGAVNWMTAGKGVVHTERTPDYLRNKSKTLHGLQIWVALPKAEEQCEPSFTHINASELPVWEEDNVSYKLIAGEAFGRKSPVPVYSKLYFIEIKSKEAKTISIGAAFGWAFIFCTKFFKSIFQKRPIPIYIKTLIGGILLGVIAFYLPITRYFGHHEINELLSGSFSLTLLFAILVFKIIAISITVTSGWRGGFIIPLFFVGATLGLIIHQLFPTINLTLAIVSCMAAINACVTRTPMSTTILLATLTGFGHFIPILFASLTGYFLAPRIPFIGSQMKKE